jgi:ESX secretion system protein EccC
LSGNTEGTLLHHRPARLFPAPLAAEPVTIASPPLVPEGRRGLALQLALPLVGSLSILGFAFIFRNTVFLIVAGAVAGLSALVTVAVAIQQRRGDKRSRRRKAARYRAYLDETAATLSRLADEQRARLAVLHPDADAAWVIATGRERLWERRPDDPDFLDVRIGVGPVPFAVPVHLDTGNDPLAEHDPDLLAHATTLADAYQTLEPAPVVAPFAPGGTVAVVGDREAGRALVRSMLCELATLHAPDDLALLAWFEPDAEAEWDWLKWLPHVRDSSLESESDSVGGVALTADPQDLEVLLAQLVEPRLAHLDRVAAANGVTPRAVRFRQAVVVLDGFAPGGALDALPSLREALARGPELNVLVLCLVDRAADVPSTARARIELAPGGWLGYAESGPDGPRLHGIRAAAADRALCESLARALAPVRLRGSGGRAERVESEGLLDLLRLVGRDRSHLRTPIGVADDGLPLVLDLTEAAEGGMGPHGLVVGATGSGKSELLRTLVAGLALQHDPDELAFVFVDYKGGATFAELGDLPHVAGLITNLERDLTLVDRMRDALFGELERRQRLLREAGPFDRARDYQRHRAAHPELELEPLPSLVVVVDEFGELLTSRPDFLDFFVSAGRTGRSLGMHLLLATQRLDEGRIRGLEGHLRYRICLRTFSPEESLVALGTRHAYELPPIPGLAYLRVDGGLRRFKTAYAGRPFRRRRAATQTAAVVQPFEIRRSATQRPVEDAPPAERREGESSELQIAIAGAARRPSARPRQVWLPPLPGELALGSLVDLDEPLRTPGDRHWLRAPLGLVDRPRRQTQDPLELDFSGAGGHLAVVGAPRSGKSTLLQTLVTALALTHDPQSLQLYCVDFGGGGLRGLAGLPHVGAVYGRDDIERINRLVRELQSIVAERSAHDDARPTDDPYGEVFLVIDNWALLVQEHDELERALVELVAGGLHYGVHVVLSANRWNDVRLAVRDNVGGRLELRLNDPIESEIDRQAAKTVPSTAGRGLARGGEQFQAALPASDLEPGGLERLVAVARGRAGDRDEAPPIPLLPSVVHARDLPDPRDDGPGVAIGVDEYRLQPARIDLFGADTHLLVLGDGESGKSSLLRGLCSRICAHRSPDELRVAVVDYRRQLRGAVPDSHLYGYAFTPDAAVELAGRLATQLRARLPAGELTTDAPVIWSGPDLLLVVDDYDLVAGATGNPLEPLTDLLAYGRDVGFNVVVARRVAGLARASFESFLQRLRELGGPGVLLGGDPQEGPVLAEHKAAPLPPGRAKLVRRRRAALVQTLFTPPDSAASPPAADAAVGSPAVTDSEVLR